MLPVFENLFSCLPAAAVGHCLPCHDVCAKECCCHLYKLLPTYRLQLRHLLFLSGESLSFTELCCLLARRAYYAASNGRHAATMFRSC